MTKFDPHAHLNGHVLAAVDVETTGPILGFHEICEISIMPLNRNMTPMCLPFDMILAPDFPERVEPEALAVNKLTLRELSAGVPQARAAEMLVEWFEKINIPIGKRLIPLAHNWRFDSSIIQMWLGYRTFHMIFDGRYRDTMVAANFCNDIAGAQLNTYPYPKVNLSYLAGVLGVEVDNAHRAMDDARVTFQCYDALVQRGFTFGTTRVDINIPDNTTSAAELPALHEAQ